MITHNNIPQSSLVLILGGSWVVISRIISPLIWVMSIVILLITLLITTHEPPSTQKPKGFGFRV